MVHRVWSRDQHQVTTRELVRNPNSTLTDSDWTGPAVRFLRLSGDSELGDFGGELFADGWAIQSTVNLWYNHLLCFLISFPLP